MGMFICDHAGAPKCGLGDDCDLFESHAHRSPDCHPAEQCGPEDGKVNYKRTRCVSVDSEAGKKAVKRAQEWLRRAQSR